jgi:hypothetical protein
MSGLFDNLGPFQDNLTNERRGKLALRLTKACAAAPEAREAAVALGSLYDPAKREEALSTLNAMGSIPRRHVLAAYQRLSIQARD